MRLFLTGILATLLAPVLWAGDLPLPMTAKLLSLVAKSSSDGARIACKDPNLAGELQKLGIEINSAARIVWTDSPAEVRMLSSQNRCVVSNSPTALSAGASLVMFEEGGKPKLMVNARNLQKSGVALSDQILKAAVSGQ